MIWEREPSTGDRLQALLRTSEHAMKYRFGIVLAIVLSALALGSVWMIENGTDTAPDRLASVQIERPDGDHADTEVEGSAAQIDDLEEGGRMIDTVTGDEAGGSASSLVFGRASPAQIESTVYQRIAEQPGLELTSLRSVECDTLRCTIVFSGVDVNPRYVDKYHELDSALGRPPWHDYQPTQSSLGTREVAPGVREYVLEFTYVALVNASDEPQVAGRQHAACAGAWTRVAQLRGSNEYMRMARERAAEHLEIAARTLGLEEARRLATELQFGPLTRECHAMPY
jgi:hypothetical protein